MPPLMADDDPVASWRVGGKPTDAVLRRVSDALVRDRRRLRSLAGAPQGRLVATARKRVDAEITGALERLRSAGATPTTAVAIRGARPGAPRSLQRVLQLRAPSGRSIRVRTAERGELIALARASDDNSRRAFGAIRHNAGAIDALAARLRELEATQRELIRVLGELQSRGDVALLETLTSGLGELDSGLASCRKQLQLDARSTRRLVTGRVGALERNLSSLTTAARVQKLNDAATTMQTAAFGTKGNLLDRGNLLIAANHVAWGLLGDAAKWLGIAAGPSSLLGLLSPVASLLVAQLAFGNRQHERFVSGVADGFVHMLQSGPPRAETTVLLQPHIAPSLWPEFRQRTNVLVTLVPLVIPNGADTSARVVDGVLTITLSHFGSTDEANTFRVGWTVDTQALG